MLQCPVPWMKCFVPVQARQRALGNIQFIGFLYKKKMLTEKIMHSCIMRLMNDVRAPPGAAVLLSLLAIACGAFRLQQANWGPQWARMVAFLHMLQQQLHYMPMYSHKPDRSWYSVTCFAQQAFVSWRVTATVGCCSAGA